jgi:arabinose-5-phosphate isomerase
MNISKKMDEILKDIGTSNEHFLQNINRKMLIKTLSHFEDREKTFYFIGVGKSKNIAKHTTDMLKSIGYCINLIDPTDILHGDLGLVRPNNYVFLYSKSGNTKELVDIVPYLRKKETYIVGVFCNQNGKLNEMCDETLILPNAKEMDKFGLMPTTSIMYFTMFCNILVSYLTKDKKTSISLEEYSQNHPAGNIGLKTNIKLDDLMYHRKNTSILDINTNIIDCMIDMSEKHSSCSIVTRDGTYCGVVSGGDIRKYVSKHRYDKDMKLSDIGIGAVVNTHAYTIDTNTNVQELVGKIKENDNKFLSGIPVLDQSVGIKIVGLVDMKSIFNIFELR